jgi:arsenite-transporting ATPase
MTDTGSSSPLLQQRAHNEKVEIDAVSNRHAKRYALVPLLKTEPIGVDRLMKLSAHSPSTLTLESHLND